MVVQYSVLNKYTKIYSSIKRYYSKNWTGTGILRTGPAYQSAWERILVLIPISDLYYCVEIAAHFVYR